MSVTYKEYIQYPVESTYNINFFCDILLHRKLPMYNAGAKCKNVEIA